MYEFKRLTALAGCLGWLAAAAPAGAEVHSTMDELAPGVHYIAASGEDDRQSILQPVRLCRTIQSHAAAEGLPMLFFTRLIWRESRFDPKAVSPVGAQGIAQFMPGTAKMRNLEDPFDPVQALPKSAELLADLYREFGNWGLAAAAYNAGPGRVYNWLKGKSKSLPKETRDYVKYITGKPAKYWRDVNAAQPEHLAGDAYSVEDWCLAQPAPIWNTPWPRNAWHLWVAEDVSLDEAMEKVKRLREALDEANRDTVRPLVVPLDKTERDGRPRFAVMLSTRTRMTAQGMCQQLVEGEAPCRIMRG